jgi:hypothetical protein
MDERRAPVIRVALLERAARAEISIAAGKDRFFLLFFVGIESIFIKYPGIGHRSL